MLMIHNQRRIVFSFLVFTLISGLLSGCGSSGGQSPSPVSTAPTSTATGKATLSVRWPASANSRLIPFAANSIYVRLTATDGTRLFGDALLVRPQNGGTATASFDRLPLGPLTVAASALPNADGTGVAQAGAQTAAVIVAGQVTPISLTLASTISEVTVSPATANLVLGQKITATATAKNAAGEVVLISPSTLSWTSSAPASATVDAAGLVTGVAVGSATITATEIESGKAGTLAASVIDPNANPPLLYEGFDYTAGAGLPGQNGGTGDWSTAWSYHGAYSAPPSAINNGTLTFGRLLTGGNSMRPTSSIGIGDDRKWNTVIGTPGTTTYFSTLLKPEMVSGGYPTTYFGIVIYGQYFGKSSDFAEFGIEREGTGGFVSAGVTPQVNTTYFLVVRATFTSNSVIYNLFINPTPGQALPATPNATKTVSRNASDLVTGISYSGSVFCVYDELRVGPTWESVSPLGQ